MAHERTSNYLRQLRSGAFFRAVAAASSFLMIPVMLGYLGKEAFGVWSTLLSVLSWIVFFDLGIGNGLKNAVTASLAKGERESASEYVSAGYTAIGVFVCAAAVGALGTTLILPWQSVFNTSAVSEHDLRLATSLVAVSLLANFWLGIVSGLWAAMQSPSTATAAGAFGNVVALLITWLASHFTERSVPVVAGIYGLSIVCAQLLSSIFFFRFHPQLRPKICRDVRYFRPLLSTGLKFFVIQLAVLVVFTTDKLLISHLFTPAEVADYEIATKFFSVLTIFHGLIVGPLWTAYGDAFHRKDFSWLRSMLRHQLRVFCALACAAAVLLACAPAIIHLWVGSTVTPTFPLLFASAIFSLLCCWNNVFSTFANGTGQIRVQMHAAIGAMITNIPLSIFLGGTLGMGVPGVILGTAISLLGGALAVPLHVRKVLAIDHGAATT